MPWQAFRNIENRIETNFVIGISRICGKKVFCGSRDPFLLLGINGVCSFEGAFTGFDFDRQQRVPAFCDQIDLAHGRPIALCENAVPLDPEHQGGPGLCVASPVFGLATFPAHDWESAPEIARAIV
jgi:hypothetical protein